MSIKTTIGKLFQEQFNIDFTSMEINVPKDVSEMRVGVLSYNEESGGDEYKLVKTIVRKPNSIKYQTFVAGHNPIESSGEHRFYVYDKENNDYAYKEVQEIIGKENNYHLLALNDWKEIEKIVKTDELIPILDIEVEGNHNYYSNGILSHNTIYGNPTTTPGGNALKFYATQRLEVKRGAQIKLSEDEVIGHDLRITVVKNKIASPYKKVITPLMYGKGFNKVQEVLEMAISKGIVERKGSWVHYNGESLAQGLDRTVALLEDNLELYEEIKNKI